MKRIFTLLFIALNFSLTAQTVERCGTKKAMDRLLQLPGQHDALELANEQIRNYLDNHQQKVTTSGTNTLYTIPVVVHVIHTGGAVGTQYNPSDAAIQAMIDKLNDIFANQFDLPSTSGAFNSVDIPIRFALAQRDPNCNATTGITRLNYSSNATYLANGSTSDPGNAPGLDDQIIKALDTWPVSDYYNIWIVHKIEGSDGTSGTYTAGYALLPNTYISKYDGTIMLANEVIQNTTTLAHEMGHAFSLEHPFEGGSPCPSNADCAVDNDKVCDTDPTIQQFACPTGTNACTGQVWSGSTTQYNHMGYTVCADRFTAGQSARAIASLLTQRPSLATSLAVDPPPISSPFAASCNPTIINATSNFNMGPTRVTFNEIDYNSTGYWDNVNFSAPQVVEDKTCSHRTELSLSQGTYPISVVTSQNSQRVRAYIDYNNNGTFDLPAEQAMLSNGPGGNYTHTANVVLPATATLNTPLRMRVIADFSSGALPGPCTAFLYGQAEDFTVVITQLPLSNEWRNIYARPNNSNNTINVDWSLVSETANIFEVLHSQDGISFNKIGRVNAIQTKTNYSFVHQLPNEGNNYYKINVINIDGSSSMSKIVKANLIPSQTRLNLIPNPVSSQLTIQLEAINNLEKIEGSILDITGHQVSKMTLTKNSNQVFEATVPVSNLASGIYFVQIDVNGKMTYRKFIKE